MDILDFSKFLNLYYQSIQQINFHIILNDCDNIPKLNCSSQDFILLVCSIYVYINRIIGSTERCHVWRHKLRLNPSFFYEFSCPTSPLIPSFTYLLFALAYSFLMNYFTFFFFIFQLLSSLSLFLFFQVASIFILSLAASPLASRVYSPRGN